ncbi:carbohydrate ABC transporter permease [Azospirillum griseum]|uniref:Sugar ABC transporter permease n=1 Tax=Azospirillum griseum TaxID=2496639 RepID=A0A3S0KA79_9PROT|nr:sugar ABC transporter permease [Azospirillum griseum]RTR18850.1 sugar ABC transporter permease [Azospirillum griseum]
MKRAETSDGERGATPTGARARRPSLIDRIGDQLPKIVVAPTFLITLVFVYGFIAWTTYLSFTRSTMRPSMVWEGLRPHERLWGNPVWHTALGNLGTYALLYIGLSTLMGMLLAILLDQRIRAEGALRTIYLYPMALSFIVTGTAWKWILNPGLGIEKLMHDFGFQDFQFQWLVDPDMAIYCLVIAGVWQSSGFVMAMFLAALRGIDGEIIKAAQIDGAGLLRIYARIIIPMMRPVFLSSFIILGHLAIKSFDLVVALTGGGPGNATALPATFMYEMTFTRNQVAVGAASAVVMLMTVCAVIVPYLYSELRPKGGAHG